MSARAGWGMVIAAAALGLACESTPPPRDALAEAETAVARSRANDADEFAPLAQRKAEEKLEQARAAARDDDQYGTARRLAEQAKVDAELALAESERAKTQKDVDELAQTVRALEEEIDHGLDN